MNDCAKNYAVWLHQCVCVVVIKVAGCAQTFPRNIDTNETKDMIHVAQPQLMAFPTPFRL